MDGGILVILPEGAMINCAATMRLNLLSSRRSADTAAIMLEIRFSLSEVKNR